VQISNLTAPSQGSVVSVVLLAGVEKILCLIRPALELAKSRNAGVRARTQHR
jgi:hypothetical protein